jgi:glucose-1-phosphate cytidylyltransferase
MNKVVIFAGGKGTRIEEESATKPKPMIEIGGMPIIWHIMKIYSQYGINEFIICLGYKGNMIKEYFQNYASLRNDLTLDFSDSTSCKFSYNMNRKVEPWVINLVDTGLESNTSQRLKQVRQYIGNDKEFLLTYGDGVADVNIDELLKFHKSHNKFATVTAVQPDGRFGALDLDEKLLVKQFIEKPKGDKAWINGGFFVLDTSIFYHLDDKDISFEEGPLKKMAKKNELMAFKHSGFWHPMDTLRDLKYLENLWKEGNAPWKIWD